MRFYRNCISCHSKLWTWYVFTRQEHLKLNQKWSWYTSRWATKIFHKRKILSMAWSLYQLYLINWEASPGSWFNLTSSILLVLSLFRSGESGGSSRLLVCSGDCSGGCSSDCCLAFSSLEPFPSATPGLPKLFPFPPRLQPWRWYSASWGGGDARWIWWSAE
jgi:hypothetical protein